MTLGRLYVDGLGTFEGELIGKETTAFGELVFTTSPSGYIKSITDPSYIGQILIFSFPYIGSYGLDERWESERPKVRGVVVNHVPDIQKEAISDYLEKWGIPCVIVKRSREIIDYIRMKGNSLGSIGEKVFENPYKLNLVDETVGEEIGKDGRVLLLDLGYKRNILDNLEGYTISIIPYNKFEAGMIEKVEGVIISNGPGDPSFPGLGNFTDRLREIVGRKPILGICLGHQLLSIALGMKTEKMKFGHRSINHPVEDLAVGRIAVTTHNHGFAVIFDKTKGVEERYRSLNDNTNEGLQGKNLLTVQFHPEGGPGPHDELGVFSEFRRMMNGDR